MVGKIVVGGALTQREACEGFHERKVQKLKLQKSAGKTIITRVKEHKGEVDTVIEGEIRFF